jgi:hypothetical protein
VIRKRQLPSPLRKFLGIPPQTQNARLATAQQDKAAQIIRVRPQLFQKDRVTATA